MRNSELYNPIDPKRFGVDATTVACSKVSVRHMGSSKKRREAMPNRQAELSQHVLRRAYQITAHAPTQTLHRGRKRKKVYPYKPDRSCRGLTGEGKKVVNPCCSRPPVGSRPTYTQPTLRGLSVTPIISWFLVSSP